MQNLPTMSIQWRYIHYQNRRYLYQKPKPLCHHGAHISVAFAYIGNNAKIITKNLFILSPIAKKKPPDNQVAGGSKLSL
jgi:hypothetical protein